MMMAVEPVRILKWGGGTRPSRCVGKFLFDCVPPLFWLYKYNNNRFGERFRDDQYSLVSFLFAVFILTVPPVPSHL